MSRQPPADRTGRRGEHTAGVRQALADFLEAQTHPRGRTGGRSPTSEAQVQRMDPDSERPDDAERGAIVRTQVADVATTGGEVWLFDLDRRKFRIVDRTEAMRLVASGKATLHEPRVTAREQMIVD